MDQGNETAGQVFRDGWTRSASGMYVSSARVYAGPELSDVRAEARVSISGDAWTGAMYLNGAIHAFVTRSSREDAMWAVERELEHALRALGSDLPRPKAEDGEGVTLASLATTRGFKATELLMHLLSRGHTRLHLNSKLTMEQCRQLADHFGWDEP